jgi:RHS repeat-associated protein
VVKKGTPETTWYAYDAAGQRVRKVTERQAAVGQTPTRAKERIYLGGFEVYREYEKDGATVKLERETLHVMDDEQRIALVETRTQDQGNDPAPAQLTRYQLANHLGSASLELDDQAQIISYEEYYPYGSTSYQAARSQTETPKRYRYTGKERDDESGLYYHGARYYAPWLGRWLSADPINNEWYNAAKGESERNVKRQAAEQTASTYEYCYDNPLRFTDPTGEQVPPEPKDQTLKEGRGPVQHQTYQLSVKATENEFARFAEAFTTDPGQVTNNFWAKYETDDRDKSGGLSAGDIININIFGPDNGSVRVDSVSASKKHFQATFQTLEGHPEAGSITFTAVHTTNAKGEGTMLFQVANVTRQSLGGAEALPGAIEFGRWAQVDQWKIVMANVGAYLGKNVSAATKQITTVFWDDEKDAPSNLGWTEREMLTEEVNEDIQSTMTEARKKVKSGGGSFGGAGSGHKW